MVCAGCFDAYHQHRCKNGPQQISRRTQCSSSSAEEDCGRMPVLAGPSVCLCHEFQQQLRKHGLQLNTQQSQPWEFMLHLNLDWALLHVGVHATVHASAGMLLYFCLSGHGSECIHLQTIHTSPITVRKVSETIDILLHDTSLLHQPAIYYITSNTLHSHQLQSTPAQSVRQ